MNVLRWRRCQPHYAVLFAFLIVDLTSCATFSRHRFIDPGADWQTRSGQLMYRTTSTTLMGEALVRFSKSGNFQLMFSKGPGLPLLTLRQDATFAEIKGSLARNGWSGPINHAPKQLRGWLGLHDAIMKARDRNVVRHVSGAETFLLRF